MHVGHCRGAVFGDALASLLGFAGYDVTREYYINDAGAQVDVLARSAFLRYREALGETSARFPKGSIPATISSRSGEALAEGVRRRAAGEKSEANGCRQVRAQGNRDDDGDDPGDLAALNISHDVFFSERSLIEGGEDGSPRPSIFSAPRATSMKAACRRRRARRSRIGKIASRPCSAPPLTATTSTVR